MKLISRFMRFFFYHFYHSFAWTYDFVSAIVSIGRWNDWIETTLSSIQGKMILEIGHGPGHLQKLLYSKGFSVFGLDESMQMIRQAKRRLKKIDCQTICLSRGLAQTLPFPTRTFDTVISTFPAEYIFDLDTLSDVYRVLHNGGRFIILPAAWIVGQNIQDRIASWLFRATGETPRNVRELVTQRSVHPLEQTGFKVIIQQIEIKSSVVLVITATKPASSENNHAPI